MNRTCGSSMSCHLEKNGSRERERETARALFVVLLPGDMFFFTRRRQGGGFASCSLSLGRRGRLLQLGPQPRLEVGAGVLVVPVRLPEGLVGLLLDDGLVGDCLFLFVFRAGGGGGRCETTTTMKARRARARGRGWRVPFLFSLSLPLLSRSRAWETGATDDACLSPLWVPRSRACSRARAA